LHCDPSFVTSIADMLEKRGLASRESDPADRRVKRIVLTRAGMELRQRLENEIMANLPWRQALDADERGCLLGLLRKIVPAGAAQAGSASHLTAKLEAAKYGEEVSEVLVSAPVTGADGERGQSLPATATPPRRSPKPHVAVPPLTPSFRARQHRCRGAGSVRPLTKEDACHPHSLSPGGPAPAPPALGPVPATSAWRCWSSPPPS
jgi:DNA-binding MarR family transcriptional regulator